MATETDVASIIKFVSPSDVNFSDNGQILKYALNVAATVEHMSTHLKGVQKADLVLRAVREGVQTSSLTLS